MACRNCVLAAAMLFSLIDFGDEFYIPGVAPVDFSRGQKIDVKVTEASSLHYYYTSQPYSTVDQTQTVLP